MATATKTAPATTTATPVRKINITNDKVRIAEAKRVAELKKIISDAEKELGTVASSTKKEKPGVLVNVTKWMDGYDEAVVRGVVAIKRSSLRENTSYDAEILTSTFPEAEAAARKRTTYTFLTVTI